MNDGGNAFPTNAHDHAQGYEGMRLRDYFAAMAMQSLIANFADSWVAERKSSANEADIAEASYVMADAMLAERAKQ